MTSSRFLRGLALAAAASASLLAVLYIAPADGAGSWLSSEADTEVDGVWRSRGYGWIWSVEDGHVKMYDESGDLCLKSSRKSFDVDDNPDIKLRASEDGKIFWYQDEDDQYRYVFDKIAALPASCSTKANSDPESVFDAVVKTLSAHYAFFDARKIDWDHAVKTERAKVSADTTDRQLFRIVSSLLSRFRDSHVSLEGTISGDDVEYEPNGESAPRSERRNSPRALAVQDNPSEYWNPRVATELIGETAETDLDDDLIYGLVDGDIGYLAIRSMSGYSASEADAALRKALAIFKGTAAVIVDVSLNDGGYDTIARRLAGHFASERTLAYMKYPGDYAGPAEPQSIYVEPSEDAPYTGPVYLITSRGTVSAAEIFVLAMRALPNVTQIGEPTDGSLSDILTKPLPNRWSLALSNEIYLDSTQASWEGLGIPPHITVAVRSRSSAAEQDVAAAHRLVDHVRSLAANAGSAGASPSTP